MQKEIIENLFTKYEKWILKPLEEDIRNQDRSHFNVFIILSAVIDNLACIRYLGEIPNNVAGAVGKRYRKFIQEYLPRYKTFDQKLYSGFRCKLVHEFQLQDFDIRQDKSSIKDHLKFVNNSKICLNSSELFKDVMVAFKALKTDMFGPLAKPAIIQSFAKSGYKKWIHTE